MVTIRNLEAGDMENYWKLLNALDTETSYMMYEPKERAQRTNIQELQADLLNSVIHGKDLLLIAAEGDNMIGYMKKAVLK